MTSPIRIGSGSIILVPDARQFRKRANDDLKAIALSKNVILAPQLPREFRRDAQTKVDAVHIAGKVHLTPVLSKEFRADAQAKVNAALEAMKGTVAIMVRAETAAATAKMDAWRERQERPLRIRVQTIHEGGVPGGHGTGGPTMAPIDPMEVAKALSSLNRELNRQGGAKVPIRPQLANDAGRQLQHDMDRMANALRFQPRIAGLDARLPLGGIAGFAAMPELISQLGGLAAALEQVAGAGAAVPGILAGMAASAATLLVGVNGLKTAYKALDTVQKDSVATGASQVAAQREARDAVQDETHARRQLADAITNEQRRQRDLSLQLRGGKLAEAGAILEIQDAANKLRSGGFSNRMEYDQGVLDYEEKVQNLLEVRNRNADLAQDVAKNEKTGVANADSVLSATESLTKATERIADATRKMADGSSALGTASAKAHAALDKLSPSAAEFVKNLIALRPEFHAFAQGVQEDLTSGLTPAFNNLFHSPTIQTNMRGGMQQLASALNAQLKGVMAQAGSPQMGSFIDRIFGSTTDATRRGAGLQPMIDSIMRLSAVGAEELPRLSDAMNTLFNRFDAFVTKADKDGSLKRWMDQGLDAFTQIGRIIANIGTSFSGLNRAFGGSFLKNVDDVTKRISDFLNSGRGQDDLERLIVTSRDAMAAWKPILDDLIPVLKTVFDTGRNFMMTWIGPLDLILKLFTNMPGVVEGVVTAFATWKLISAFINPIQGALGTLQSTLANTANRLQNSTGMLGRVGEAAGGLERKIGSLAGAFAVGGPLAIALATIVSVGFEQYLNKQREVQQETQQLIQQQNEFADSLDRTTGLLTEQSRSDIGKRLSDYAPTHKGSLTGDAFTEAAKLGIGGPRGADLVTAALPGGESQYNSIMGAVREKVRPLIHGDAGLLELAKSKGLSEDDVINAFLGVPDALAKYNAAMSGLGNEQKGIANLGAIQGIAQSQGGDVLSAAIVGQALSGTRQTAQGGAPGSPAQQARAAANPNVGLPDRSPFGAGAQAFYGDGQYKVTTSLSPQDPNIAAIIKGGATPTPPVPPSTQWTYTLTHDLAQKYMTGVPQYHTGGPTKAGLGNMLDDEFVIRDRDRFPPGALEGINDGRINPDDLPHLLPGGPVPIAPPIPVPPVPVPVVPDIPVGIGEHPISGAPVAPAGPGEVTGAVTPPAPTFTPSGPLDFGGGTAPGMAPLGIPGLPALPAGAGLLGNTPTDLAGGQIPAIPPGGLNAMIFGAQGAPSGGFGAPGGQGGAFGQSFLGNILGTGGAGGKGIEGMLGADAAKFGSILMQGIMGFFGINPQYMGDIVKLIPGLANLVGGSGFSDPGAQSSVESAIAGYAADGSPIYSALGSPGTPLPDATSTGTGGGGAPLQIPGVGNFGSTAFPKGAGMTYTTSNLSELGLAPLFQNPDKGNPVVPEWMQTFVKTYGGKSLHADSSPHGSLHGNAGGPGFAVDVTGDPADMDALGSYLLANPSLSAQMIHQTASGTPQGVAGGAAVPSGTYYTTPGGTYADEGPMVHWAPSIRPLAGDAPAPLSTSPSPPSTTNPSSGAQWSPPNTSTGPQVTDPNSAGTSTGGGTGSGTTPLPPDITAQINGQLPPAQLSPTPAGSGKGPEESDADQVIALDSKGNITIESRGVAKARGDVIMGLAPKAGETGIGSGSGFHPPSSMVSPGQGLDLNPTDLMPGAGGKGLPGRLWSPTKGVMGNVGLPSKLDAVAGTSVGSADLKTRAKAMYLAAGLPESEWGAFDQLISHESSWSPTAQNPGSTAHGLGQFLNTTWATVGATKTDDADAQLQAVFRYLKQRPDYHGSPAAAWGLWQQRHWYDKGGVVDDLKGLGGVAGTFLDDAGAMALGAWANAKGGSSKLLGGAAKMLGPFGMIAPELLDAISPQAHTSSSDTLDYTKALKHVPHAAAGRYITGGSGRKDDVLAMLMGGEFVQQQKSVQTYGVDFHHALNNLMIDPKMVDALMSGAPHMAEGGTLGPQTTANDLQAIQNQLAGSITPTPPVPPSRSGVDMSQIPNVNKMMPPPQATKLQPTTTMPPPPPQPGGPSAPPPPSPLEPEAGVPVQANIAPAPKSTDHELPALKQGITSTAATLGSLAATAAGASGFGAPAAGLIAGAFNVGGKVANSIANVVSSALVGTITPGTTANPYGERIKGNQAPQTLMPMDNSTHYHGDLYANDMDDFMRRQDIRDSVQMQSQMAAAPGY